MPKGIEHTPKMETRLTAVTLTSNGKKIQAFINLPVIDGNTFLPMPRFNKMCDSIGAEVGDTVSFG